jgi:hypothetical protein
MHSGYPCLNVPFFSNLLVHLTSAFRHLFERARARAF